MTIITSNNLWGIKSPKLKSLSWENIKIKTYDALNCRIEKSFTCAKYLQLQNKKQLVCSPETPLPKAQQSWEMCFQLPASRLQRARGVGGWCLPDLFTALCKFFSHPFIEAIKKTPLPSQAGMAKGLQCSLESLTKHFDVTRRCNCPLTSYTFESKQEKVAKSKQLLLVLILNDCRWLHHFLSFLSMMTSSCWFFIS